MITFINVGVGVNSTAILALIKLGRLKYDHPVAVFSDTGAEKPETYEYLLYLQAISPIPISIIESKEGSLVDYCVNKKILPMRGLRWCSDRWKKVPLNKFRESFNIGEDYQIVIGIDYGERARTSRWRNDGHVIYPLIDLKMDRKACLGVIKEAGWEVPVKSGCYFCPYAPSEEFALLKTTHPALFEFVCKLEDECLGRLKKFKQQGWFNNKYPLRKLVALKHPETVKDQTCLFCVDW